MFPQVLQIFSIMLYITITTASECNEYIILLPANPTCLPIQFKDINWENVDCPSDATNVLTYDEINANKSCILELDYDNSYTNCKPVIKTTTYRQHETVTTEASKFNHNDTIISKAYENLTDTSESVIWNCDYRIDNSEIVCDSLQNMRKYKLLQYLNCTNNDENNGQNQNFTQNDFSINLKTAINLDKHVANNDIKDYGPFSENLVLSFKFNNDSCYEQLPPLNITNGNIYNLWSNNEDLEIRKYHNNFSIGLNLSNCSIFCDSILALKNHSSIDVNFDIILNNKNDTDLNIFIKNDLNKTDTTDLNRFIIDCNYPALEEDHVINNMTLNYYLELDCQFKDLNSVATNNNFNGSYGDKVLTTVPNSFLSTNSDVFENISTKWAETSTYKYYEYNTDPIETISAEPNTTTTQKEDELTSVTNQNTEITTTNYKGDYLGSKFDNNETGSHIKAIVYIAVVLSVIGFASVATMIGLKIWKPTTVYRAVPRANPSNTECSSL